LVVFVVDVAFVVTGLVLAVVAGLVVPLTDVVLAAVAVVADFPLLAPAAG
jgi:hypothetical protein